MTNIEIIARNLDIADRHLEGRSRHSLPWVTDNYDRDLNIPKRSMGERRIRPALDPTTDLLMPL